MPEAPGISTYTPTTAEEEYYERVIKPQLREYAPHALSQREYLMGLQDYLNRMVEGEKITGEQALAQWREGVSGWGRDVMTLPYYEAISLATTEQPYKAQLRATERRTLTQGLKDLQAIVNSKDPNRGSQMRAKKAEIENILKELYRGQEQFIENPAFTQGVVDVKKTAIAKVMDTLIGSIPEGPTVARTRDLMYNLMGTRAKPVAETAYTMPTYAPTPQQPSYAPPFYQAMAGLEGSQPWKSWFQNQYGKLLREFEAKVPEGAMPAEAMEKTWAMWLKTMKPQLEEEWGSLSPYQRGERPSAYAPPIRTVQF